MNARAPILIALWLAAAGLAARAQETNGPEKLDFDSFKIITQKNIFDPTRTARRGPRPVAARPVVERVSLAGTVIDPGEVTAFFTGGGVPDRPFKLGETVKDLKVVQITEDGVRLADSTNKTFVLDFDTRRSLRRVEKGSWEGSSDQSDPVAVASSNSDEAAPSAGASAPPSGGGDSVAERLRKRRMEEK